MQVRFIQDGKVEILKTIAPQAILNRFGRRYVEVSDVAGEKRRILELYKSQWVREGLIPRMMGLNAYRGCRVDHAAFAEALDLISIEKYLRRGDT